MPDPDKALGGRFLLGFVDELSCSNYVPMNAL